MRHRVITHIEIVIQTVHKCFLVHSHKTALTMFGTLRELTFPPMSWMRCAMSWGTKNEY